MFSTAMEPPNKLEDDDVRTEKIKVLSALVPISGDSAKKLTVRGQYKAGVKDGKPVKGYLDELSSDADSATDDVDSVLAPVVPNVAVPG